MEHAADHVIRVENVWFRYCSSCRWVLRGVDLRITRGDYIALLGPNGSGKTTLLKLMNGLLKPEKGNVIVFGMDTRRTNTSTLAKFVGLVFQNPDHHLFTDSVEEEIAVGLKAAGYPPHEVKKRVEWALEFFDLQDLRERNPLTLSLGEKKRLAIASIAVLNPGVVLLDEPTVGLDAKQRKVLWRLIEGLRQRGTAVVIATHDIEFVAYTKPLTAVLVEGRIAVFGKASEVLSLKKLLEDARLTPPATVDVLEALRRRGVVFKDALLTPEELAEALRGPWLS